jgi:uncharacterized membrane protein YphA (DoxX/SURF4 family)
MPREKEEGRDALALLILRCALAWFLFVWAVNKILEPQQYAGVWANIHGIPIGQSLPYVFGAAQILVCLMIFAGYKRGVSYRLGLAMHGVTVALILPSILLPFAGLSEDYLLARLRTDTVPILAGFVALLLLRHRDRWSLDAWRSARTA